MVRRDLIEPGPGHDACGVACVARLDAIPRHDVIERALIALERLEHRGAAGADGESGDGAGIKLALEKEFVRDRAEEFGISTRDVPDAGLFAVASCFLARDGELAAEARANLERIVRAEGQQPMGWRDVPTEPSAAGPLARQAAPRSAQLLIGAGEGVTPAVFERRLFILRRVAERELAGDLSISSLSSRTIVYKGMLTATQLAQYYPDLRDERLRSVFAVVHSRFSTNTAPSWALAQPLQMVAHNGEINTVRGNVNWMRAREAALSRSFDGELGRCLPLIDEGASDSAAFDSALELLTVAGRTAARGADDDDPDGRRGAAAAAGAGGLLPLPRAPDGAVGRARRDRRHRRPAARREPRPQRPAPRRAGSSPATAGSALAPRPAASTPSPTR